MTANQFKFKSTHINKTSVTAKPKLIGRVKLAEFLELPERDFIKHVSEVENSPLFQRLLKNEHVITYARPYRGKLSGRMMEFRDDLIAGDEGSEADVEALMLKHRDAEALIRKLGEEKFKKYFLLNDSPLTYEEAAKLCGITAAEAKAVNALVDELSVYSSFESPEGEKKSAGQPAAFYKIAKIEKDGAGEFVIAYNSSRMARGRYSIDLEKLKALINEKGLPAAESGKIDKLLRELDTINTRKAITHKILENVIEFQREYLDSGDISTLAPLTQKIISITVAVSPSVINRVIYGKTIETPQGKEVPLKDLFPSKKNRVKCLVRAILESEPTVTFSDEDIVALLNERYGMRVSRHLVQIYRVELGILPAEKRNLLERGKTYGAGQL